MISFHCHITQSCKAIVSIATSTAEVLHRPATESLRFLPEGPYSCGNGHFSWVAIQHGPKDLSGSLNLYDWNKGTNNAYSLNGRPGFAFPTDRPGVFVVGLERELGFFSTLDGSWEPFEKEIDSDKQGTIINDGLVWNDYLIFGTKDLEFKTKKAGLYLYQTPQRKLIRLRDDQICSNGKAAIPIDEHRIQLLDIDSPTRKIVLYEVDLMEGTASDAKVVVDLTADSSVPDGMTLSPEGKSAIVSMYNPDPAEHGETRMYSLSTGKLEHIWKTPGSPKNTCPQLIAWQGKVLLVITTAVENMPADQRSSSPEAGSLFAAETDFDVSDLDAPVFNYFKV